MMTKDKMRSLIDAIAKMRELATDEQAVELQCIFPDWKVNTEYGVGERLLYNGILYKTLIAHISQEDKTPDIATDLFTKVL